ncbi:hypothetical protein [Comamonas sp. NoAH]|uniref:hypothetical protein n=1 Tax=Comamonas halotolerans TaxID=3041496 RepID=UPI0024E0800A|nr:hypothetical protein [Comamonas sp. NoAH]
MTTPAPINLDKLRNAVQKFGAMSFTTSQLASDYHQDESKVTEQDVQRFEALLHRHAALLGIAPKPSSAGGDTVWQAL